jgi:ABC-2 type transport system permease protein
MIIPVVRKYLFVFKLVWIERMVYRVNFLLEILSVMFSSVIVICLWIAVYRSSAQSVLGGYTIQEMVTYLLGGGLINTFILTTAENNETSQSIQDGSLSSLLTLPISPYWLWFVRDLGSKLFLFVLGLLGYLVVLFFFRFYLLPLPGVQRLLLFVVSLALGAILQFLVFESLSLLAFWLENTYGLRFTLRVIMEVAGGAIIPLSFFPQAVQSVFYLLPFAYFFYLPMQIYLGKTAAPAVLIEFFKIAAWIACLALLNRAVWRRGVCRYTAMGD